MWTIRQERAEAFRDEALQKFEDEIVGQFSSPVFEVIGEHQLQNSIRLGIVRAGYGLTYRVPFGCRDPAVRSAHHGARLAVVTTR